MNSIMMRIVVIEHEPVKDQLRKSSVEGVDSGG
jgi:hypothetical protein